MNRRTLILPALVVLGLLATGPVAADTPAPNSAEVCAEPDARLDKYRYLRALSLDLRGKPPTVAEYAALHEREDVPEEWIDDWMKTEEFAQRTIRWHRTLLWHNVSNARLFSVPNNLRTTGGIYWRSSTLAIRLRGANTYCGDQPARFDDNGALILSTDEGGIVREGYVEVEPYWAPGTKIKVCALDARDNLVSEGGAACGQRTTVNDLSCGCGPNMRWCATGAVREAITSSMNAQVDHLIRAVVLERRPYTDLFTADRMFVNGPLAFYWKHQTGPSANLINEPSPMAAARVPDDLTFTERDRWVEVYAGPQHAGILTLPAYLLRFQTDRSRANQFYTQFMCQPFQPPANGISVDPNALAVTDLQQRDGCKYCHAILEPAAAHWGRWRERGAGYLDATAFPAESEACKLCATTGRQCSAECRSFYVLDTQDSQMATYAGKLNAYLFRDPDHNANVETGPKLLAQSATADNRMTACVAQRNLEHFYGRAITADEKPVVDALVRDFASARYDWATLVKKIVTSEAYRRVR